MVGLTAAFDAKRFRRVRFENTSDNDTQAEIAKEFYSPLGVGVEIPNPRAFVKEYQATVGNLVDSFQVGYQRPCYDSTCLKRELGLRKAIPFADNLIQGIQEQIDKIFISYVILPPSLFPEVNVSGLHSPERTLETSVFLRNLEPMFSYLTAWSYLRERFRRNESDTPEILLDNFASKETDAWRELISWCKPKVYIRGDECNELLATADILAFLTDVKLYGQDTFEERKLQPSNIERVWADYDFDVEVRYLDHYRLNKYKWHSDNLVDTSLYLTRPVVFILIDDVKRIFSMALDANGHESSESIDDVVVEKPTWQGPERKQSLEPYLACLFYANSKGGCIKFFDSQDRNLVRDGDVLVYMGSNSKRICETFQDGFDVEVYKAIDLRKKMKV